MAGTAETVADRLAATIKTANVGHVIVQPHFGSLPTETALYNLHRFAEDVMPVLRPQHDEWEDRWWPKAPGDAAPGVSVPDLHSPIGGRR